MRKNISTPKISKIGRIQTLVLSNHNIELTEVFSAQIHMILTSMFYLLKLLKLDMSHIGKTILFTTTILSSFTISALRTGLLPVFFERN